MPECRTGGRTTRRREEGTAFAAPSSISNSGISTQLPLRHCILHTCYLAGVDLAGSSLTPAGSSLVFAAAGLSLLPDVEEDGRSVCCAMLLDWTGHHHQSYHPTAIETDRVTRRWGLCETRGVCK